MERLGLEPNQIYYKANRVERRNSVYKTKATLEGSLCEQIRLIQNQLLELELLHVAENVDVDFRLGLA